MYKLSIAAATQAWLNGMAQAAVAFERVGPTLEIQPDWAARMVGSGAADCSLVLERLDLLSLQMAELDGIADAWFDVTPGSPNPARDLMRIELRGSRWWPMSILLPPLPHEADLPRLFRLARRARHHRFVAGWWDHIIRIPGVLPVVKAGANALRRL